jgi:hypothetical protein
LWFESLARVASVVGLLFYPLSNEARWTQATDLRPIFKICSEVIYSLPVFRMTCGMLYLCKSVYALNGKRVKSWPLSSVKVGVTISPYAVSVTATHYILSRWTPTIGYTGTIVLTAGSKFICPWRPTCTENWNIFICTAQ